MRPLGIPFCVGRNTMNQPFVHESTYSFGGVAGRLHRGRLARIESLLAGADLPTTGRLADFGCSNGYILARLQQSAFAHRPGWSFVGFDHSRPLLELARQRQLPRTSFRWIDMNVSGGSSQAGESFDVVTCFETLEHVGDYRPALETLVQSCKPEGVLLISVPYECGLRGLAKLIGRRVLRGDRYEGFFDTRSRLRYVTSLVTQRRIDHYRHPPQPGWGPHLGFDTRQFDRDLRRQYVAGNHCELLLRQPTLLGLGYLYLLRKRPPIARPQRKAA